LDSAANAVRTTLESPVLSNAFDAAQLKSLFEFVEVADATASEIPFDRESVETLVETDPAWDRVRVSAQKCLDALGFKTSLAELLECS
jgi:hypothetical protein